MASENEFPKIDGDILHASEINRLGYASRTFGIIPSAVYTSGPGTTNAGSILINAGSLSQYSMIKSIWHTRYAAGGNSVEQRMIISGNIQGGSASVAINNGTNNFTAFMNSLIGSPGSGFILIEGKNDGANQTDINHSSTSIRPFYGGSQFCILFELGSFVGTGEVQISPIFFQGFRGGL